MPKSKKPKKVYGKQTHYWCIDNELSLLAAFCIDLALEHSREAEMLFNQIVRAWGKPGCKEEMQHSISITREDRVEHL